MIKKIISLILVFICSKLYAQTLIVKDKITLNPIAAVAVQSDHPAILYYTNVNGELDIQEFKHSTTITIQSLGYKKTVTNYTKLHANNFTILLDPRKTNLDEIVISATKNKQSNKTLPYSITNISQKEALFQQAQTTADLLGNSGEVFIQKSQQGGGSPMIRGFSANRLIYSIDGVRMNTAIFRSGNIQNVISIDAFTIENTAILFGPGSINYGSDAIGGVMSFTTLSPQISGKDTIIIHGKSNSRFSSINQENTQHMALNIGGEKWAGVSSLNYSKFGDLKMGAHGPDDYLKKQYVLRIGDQDVVITNPNPLIQNPSAYDQINLMQKIRYQINQNLDIQYGFHFSKTSEYSRYDRHIELQNNGLPVSAIWNYGPQKWLMHHLALAHKKSNLLYDQLHLKLAQQQFEESRIDRRFNQHRLRTQTEQVIAYSANLEFTKYFNHQKIYYGLESIQNDVLSKASAIDIRDNSPILVANRYPNSQWNSYAAYKNHQWEINPLWLVQSAYRYNQFSISSDFTNHLSFYPFDFTQSEIKNDAHTGSIGLVFTPDSTWKISTNLSSGFRAPNVDDIGKIFDFTIGEVIVPNTNLNAEYAYNAEVNIAKVFGEFLKLDITGFYTHLNNALVRRPFKVSGADSILYNGNMSRVFAIQNAAYATVYGGNFSMEWCLPFGFKISTRYNYQLGIEEMENGDLSRSRHAAPAFGLSKLGYQNQKLKLELYLMYSATVSNKNLNDEEKQKPAIYAKDTNGNPYSPSWYTLNFKTQYQFHRNLTINAGIENIGNARYRPYSSGLTAPGRNFMIALNSNF